MENLAVLDTIANLKPIARERLTLVEPEYESICDRTSTFLNLRSHFPLSQYAIALSPVSICDRA